MAKDATNTSASTTEASSSSSSLNTQEVTAVASNNASTTNNMREKNLLDMAQEEQMTRTTGAAAAAATTTTTQQPQSTAVQSQRSNGGTTTTTTTASTRKTSALEARMRELEQELAASKAMLKNGTAAVSGGFGENNAKKNDSALLMELQKKLQSEMASKAETEHMLRKARKQVADLQTHMEEQTAEFEKYRGLETTLMQTLQAKEEAENSLSMALQRIESLAKEQLEQQEKMEVLQHQLNTNKDAMAAQQQELQKIREQRDEQERREMSLTNRLNQAKKKEAGKTNEAEKYEEQLAKVSLELQTSKLLLNELQTSKERLQQELEETILSSRHRQVQTEAALVDERRLNEDRKQKMKVFIEKKSEEIRQAREDNQALQSELNQNSRSLSELNIRWKQLHAQWVQSQTRNRELQRDLHRIKKDSETLHKVGDTLEMKLSRSATETEEHKVKRLAAKHELMTVLRTLETEREVTARLRDSIKFTFTPKALSQQQLLNESVEDFETQLVKLSIKLRKPLPPPTLDDAAAAAAAAAIDDDGWIDAASSSTTIMEEQLLDADNSHEHHPPNRSHLDTNRLIEKLNRETQQVSKCIMSFVASIERMHALLDSSGDRTCYAMMEEILGTAAAAASTTNTSSSRTTTGGGHRHVPVPTTACSSQSEHAADTGGGSSSPQRLHSITSSSRQQHYYHD